MNLDTDPTNPCEWSPATYTSTWNYINGNYLVDITFDLAPPDFIFREYEVQLFNGTCKEKIENTKFFYNFYLVGQIILSFLILSDFKCSICFMFGNFFSERINGICYSQNQQCRTKVHKGIILLFSYVQILSYSKRCAVITNCVFSYYRLVECNTGICVTRWVPVSRNHPLHSISI